MKFKISPSRPVPIFLFLCGFTNNMMNRKIAEKKSSEEFEFELGINFKDGLLLKTHRGKY